MKNSFKILQAFTLIIVVICLNSCSKKSDSTTVVAYGSLNLQIHTNINNTEVAANTVGIDPNGRHFMMSLAQFYISGISLQKTDGTFQLMKNVYFLKTIPNLSFTIDSVPAGDYKSISFNVGIDSATNTKDPSLFLASSPLYTQNPSMWFGNTNQGYMFMNIQGTADTSSTNTGNVNYPFIVQLGSSSSLRTVILSSKSYSVSAGSTATVQIIADYGKLFQGVSFGTMFNGIPTTPFTNPSVCTQIANNIQTMFR